MRRTVKVLGQTSSQPASCWTPVLLLQGCLPGRLQDCSLQHTHSRSATRCQDRAAILDMEKLGCLTCLACVLGQIKGSMAPVESFQPTLSPPSLQTPSLCFMCSGSRVRETMLRVCVWPYLCHKHQSRAHTSSPSVLLFLSLSHILRLQHLLIKVSL